MLPGKPLGTSSFTLLNMLSRMLLIALDGTLPTCLTIHFKVISEDALMHTPKHFTQYNPNCTACNMTSLCDYTLPSNHCRSLLVRYIYTPRFTSKYDLKYTAQHALNNVWSCTWWHTTSLLDCTLWNEISTYSPAHSRVCSQVGPQLHSMAHLQSTLFHVLNYTPRKLCTSNLTRLYAPMKTHVWSIQRLSELHLPGTWSSVAGGMW